MQQLKAVIFDIDGVLVDSRDANAEFYAFILEKAGYERPKRARIDAIFHLPMRQSIEQLTGSKDPAEVERIWKTGHDRSAYPAHLLEFPKSLEPVLRALHKKYRLAIVTSRVKNGVQTIYDASGIGRFFDVAVSFEDYENPKPHPEPLQTALKKLEIEPDEAVYIGDSHTDIEAAREAHVWSIHLAPRRHDDATLGITDFAEIPSAVNEIASGLSSGTLKASSESSEKL